MKTGWKTMPIAKMAICAILILGTAAAFVSCKGDPAKNPRIDITTPGLFSSAPDSAMTVMAVNFEALMRDPDAGPSLRETMAESSEQAGQNIPLWDYVTYMHGAVIYSPIILGPRPMMSGIAILLCVEMDRPAAEKYLEAEFTADSISGFPVFAPGEKTGENAFLQNEIFNNGVVIAILSDTELVYGDRPTVTSLLETRARGSQAAEDAMVPMKGQTTFAMSIRLGDAIQAMLAEQDTADMSAEELEKIEAMKKVESVQTSMTIEGDSCITESVIRAPGLDRETLQTIVDTMGSSFLFGAGDGGTEPEITYESWGMRLRIIAPKEKAFSIMGMGM